MVCAACNTPKVASTDVCLHALYARSSGADEGAVGYEEAARAIEAAVAKAIGEGRATRDVGGKLGTIAAGAAIVEILQAE